MPHPLLLAARIAPYRRATSTVPIAVDDTGLSVTSGTVLVVSVLDNDLRPGGNPQVTIVGSPTGPVTAQVINGTQLQVSGNPGLTGAPQPFSIVYQLRQVETGATAQATASGVVTEAVAGVATIVAQWDLNASVEDAIGTIDGVIVNNVKFDQPSMLQGVSGTGVAMNGLGYLRIDDPGTAGAAGILKSGGVRGLDLRSNQCVDTGRRHERATSSQGRPKHARRLRDRISSRCGEPGGQSPRPARAE